MDKSVIIVDDIHLTHDEKISLCDGMTKEKGDDRIIPNIKIAIIDKFASLMEEYTGEKFNRDVFMNEHHLYEIDPDT